MGAPRRGKRCWWMVTLVPPSLAFTFMATLAMYWSWPRGSRVIPALLATRHWVTMPWWWSPAILMALHSEHACPGIDRQQNITHATILVASVRAQLSRLDARVDVYACSYGITIIECKHTAGQANL